MNDPLLTNLEFISRPIKVWFDSIWSTWHFQIEICQEHSQMTSSWLAWQLNLRGRLIFHDILGLTHFKSVSICSRGSPRLSSQLSRLRQVTRQMLVYLSTLSLVIITSYFSELICSVTLSLFLGLFALRAYMCCAFLFLGFWPGLFHGKNLVIFQS